MFSTERVRPRAGPRFWGESCGGLWSVLCYVVPSCPWAALRRLEGLAGVPASAAVAAVPPMPVPETIRACAHREVLQVCASLAICSLPNDRELGNLKSAACTAPVGYEQEACLPQIPFLTLAVTAKYGLAWGGRMFRPPRPPPHPAPALHQWSAEGPMLQIPQWADAPGASEACHPLQLLQLLTESRISDMSEWSFAGRRAFLACLKFYNFKECKDHCPRKNNTVRGT